MRERIVSVLIIAAFIALAAVDRWQVERRLHSIEVMGLMERDSIIATSYRLKQLEHPEFDLHRDTGGKWPFTKEEFIEWRQSDLAK